MITPQPDQQVVIGGPSGAPEPPLVDLHPGRSQMAMARARLALRSFRGGWAIFVESRIGVLSLATIVLFALMAISHPILMATVWDAEVYDPVTGYAFDRLEQPSPPNWRHPLGTDPLGRDVLSQLLSSTRSEFVLGITAALVTVGNRHHGWRGGGLLRRVGGLPVHASGGPDHSVAWHLAADRAQRAVQAEPVLPGAHHRHPGRLWRNRDHPQIAGVEHPGETLHRGGACGRRRALPHYFRAHRSEPAAPFRCCT